GPIARVATAGRGKPERGLVARRASVNPQSIFGAFEHSGIIWCARAPTARAPRLWKRWREGPPASTIVFAKARMGIYNQGDPLVHDPKRREPQRRSLPSV